MAVFFRDRRFPVEVFGVGGDGDFGGVNVTFMTKLVNSLPESSLRAVAVGMTARSCGSK